jgi:hypothetical protein
MAKNLSKSIFTYPSKPTPPQYPPRTIPNPNLRLKLPRIVVPKEVKIDFKNQFRQIMKEQERGVRRKRYGPL